MSDDADWPDEGADDTALVLIPRFIAAAAGPFWFSAVGQPLAAPVRRDARAWLGALGFPHATPIALRDWRESAEAAESTGIDDAAPARSDARVLAESMHVTACAGHALDTMLREHP